MPTIIIEGEVYDWTPSVREGDSAEPFSALLTSLYVSRITVRARAFATKNPSATYEEIQEEILRLASAFEFDDELEPDAVEVEALEIAEETIRAKLAAQGLPPPKSLRDHAQMIVNEPAIVAEAHRRVRARAQTTREIFGDIRAPTL